MVAVFPAVEGEGDEKALKMVSLNWCISVGLFGCCFVHSVLYLHVLGYVFFVVVWLCVLLAANGNSSIPILWLCLFFLPFY